MNLTINCTNCNSTNITVNRKTAFNNYGFFGHTAYGVECICNNCHCNFQDMINTTPVIEPEPWEE